MLMIRPFTKQKVLQSDFIGLPPAEEERSLTINNPTFLVKPINRIWPELCNQPDSGVSAIDDTAMRPVVSGQMEPA